MKLSVFLPALSVAVLLSDVASASRAACEEAITKAGFEPEMPYSFEEGGFFRRAKHIFGVFGCELNSGGTVERVLRGDRVIAEGGFYGVQVLALREAILSSASERRAHAADQRDRQITEIRNTYQREEGEIERRSESALRSLREGVISTDILDALQVPKEAYQVLIESVDDTPTHLTAEQANELAREEQAREEQAREIEERRKRLLEELPEIEVLLGEAKFTQAIPILNEALKLDAWPPSAITKLEETAFASVRPIPSSDLEQNEAGYHVLSLLAPENETYQSSFLSYKERRVRQNEAEAAQRRRDREAEAAQRRRDREAELARARSMQLQEARERFQWIAQRLTSRNSEAQRQYAWEQVNGKLLLGEGRVSSVERGGLLAPPTVTFRFGSEGLSVYCLLPRDTTGAQLARISLGSTYECKGTALSYTFIMGSAGMGIKAE